MGYGGLPDFTEYDPAGQVLLDGTLGKNVQDFRTYLCRGAASRRPPVARGVAWHGSPDPAVGELERGDPGAAWRVLAGASAGALAPVATAQKNGKLSDDDRGAHERTLRGGPGAERAGRGDRDFEPPSKAERAAAPRGRSEATVAVAVGAFDLARTRRDVLVRCRWAFVVRDPAEGPFGTHPACLNRPFGGVLGDREEVGRSLGRGRL